eukprot:scaffold15108_cov180-Amphora_coffeaeformis.AAC.80
MAGGCFVGIFAGKTPHPHSSFQKTGTVRIDDADENWQGPHDGARKVHKFWCLVPTNINSFQTKFFYSLLYGSSPLEKKRAPHESWDSFCLPRSKLAEKESV